MRPNARRTGALGKSAEALAHEALGRLVARWYVASPVFRDAFGGGFTTGLRAAVEGQERAELADVLREARALEPQLAALASPPKKKKSRRGRRAK